MKKRRAQRSNHFTGALEVKARLGVLHLSHSQDLSHFLSGRQNCVELIWAETCPKLYKVAVAEGAACGNRHVIRGVVVAVAVDKHVDCVLELSSGNVRADLVERNGKEVKALEPERLIGRYKHSAALVELYKVFPCLDSGLRNNRALAHDFKSLVILGGVGHNAAVIHAVNIGYGCYNVRQNIGALHTLTHGAAYIFGEQRRGV